VEPSAKLTSESEDFGPLLAAVKEAEDPMQRERLLDAHRLLKLDALAGTDPFSCDAALAHLTASLVLDQWDLGEPSEMRTMLESFS
jgi:hypothetical protein